MWLSWTCIFALICTLISSRAAWTHWRVYNWHFLGWNNHRQNCQGKVVLWHKRVLIHFLSTFDSKTVSTKLWQKTVNHLPIFIEISILEVTATCLATNTNTIGQWILSNIVFSILVIVHDLLQHLDFQHNRNYFLFTYDERFPKLLFFFHGYWRNML